MKVTHRSCHRIIIFVLGLVLVYAPPGLAATITVDTPVDEAPAVNGNCTLREAIDAANTDGAVDGCVTGSGADSIEFAGNFTITLSEGEITVNTEMSLNGLVSTSLVIDGNNANRAFVLGNAASNLVVWNATIQNCVTSGAGGAILVSSPDATLTANVVTFDNNQASAASGNGGAISSSGNVFLNNVIFTNNSAGGDGGAINISGSTLEITDGLFGTFPVVTTGNTAGDNGGAINISVVSALDQVLIVNTVFFDNEAGGSGNSEMGGGAIWANTVNNIAFVFQITNGQFLANRATSGNGGAILATNDSRIAYLDPLLPFASGIALSHFELNEAQGPDDAEGSGGAIYNRGVMSIVSSSFLLNSTSNGAGGAIAHNPGADRALTIANATFNQNSTATSGGAIASLHATSGTVELINCTIEDNTADETLATPGGGGIYNNNGTAAEFDVINTIISNNTSNAAPGNCAGDPLTDSGNNLQFAPATGCGTMTVGDPMLQAATIDPILPAYALVWVMPLNTNSLAAGAGDQATCNVTPGPIIALDGRGQIRPQNHVDCDIGAYESSVVPVELMSFWVE